MHIYYSITINQSVTNERQFEANPLNDCLTGESRANAVIITAPIKNHASLEMNPINSERQIEKDLCLRYINDNRCKNILHYEHETCCND